MRVRALAAALAVAAASSGLVAGVASAATSPTSATNAFTMEGATNASLLGAQQGAEYTGSSVTASGGQGTVSVSSPGGGVSFTFPTGATPAPGTYQGQRFPSDPTTTANVDISRGSFGCNQVASTVIVHEVALDSSGVVTSFAATYSARCENVQPPVTGELRFNSTVPYERFGWMALGTQTAVHTVTVNVTAPTTFGTAKTEGPDAVAFRPVNDTCSGKTFAAGTSCTVGVIARASHAWALAADLRLPADSGDRVVGLTASGIETATGTYTSLSPSRILDTRKRVGVPTTTPLGQGSVMDVQAVNVGGLPTGGISSVVINLTAVAPTASGYLTAYPSGSLRPSASSISFAAHTTTANLVTVPLGSNGKFRLYNYAGATHILADVVGYYHSSTTAAVGDQDSDVETVTPFRTLDTRNPGYGALPSQYYYLRSLDYGSDFNSRIRAFAVNVTVVGPQAAGYVTAWDGLGDLPSTSTINFDKGATVANMAIVRTGVCPSDCTHPGAPTMAFYNGSPGALHLVVDVVGIYYQGVDGDRGWRYRQLPNPTRYIDSRKGLGLVTNITAGATRPVNVPSSVAGYNTYAVVSNLTVASPSARTYLTLWQNDPSVTRPPVSNINASPGQVVSNMAMTEVWTHNDIQIYNASGTTPVIADAAGTFELYPGYAVPPGQAAKAGAAPAVVPAHAPTGPTVRTVDGGAPAQLR